MIGQETLQSAIKWTEIGARWIENGAVRLGLNYLDRAISAFGENDELAWEVFAKHHKLAGLKVSGREDQAVAMFEEVMQGYTVMEDSYGKALLLAHLAECLSQQGRNERAMAHLNLAYSIAGSVTALPLQAHILVLQATLTAQRNNLLFAVKLFRKAEGLLEQAGEPYSALEVRFMATRELARLGERSDAIALLEDIQNKLLSERLYRKAVESLALLSRLYEEMEMWEEKNRVSQLVYLCGQSMTKDEDLRKDPNDGKPRIQYVEKKSSEPPKQVKSPVPGLQGRIAQRRPVLQQKSK